MPEAPKKRLVGYANFVRNNPLSDKFGINKFHHIEFYTTDATTLCKRLQHGLGMQIVAKSDLADGNNSCTSFVLKSNDLVFVVTAPHQALAGTDQASCAIPGYSADLAFEFVKKHGFAVRAIGIHVDDSTSAHDVAVQNGATSILSPQTLNGDNGSTVMSEVLAYGDVVLRFISGTFEGPFLPTFTAVEPQGQTYGLKRLDHCVGNVPNLFDTTDYLMKITGMHEFAEFTAEDIGTVDSGLNSMVLASNTELVLLPINEPTFGTRRKSQIQTYLDYNNGPGVQHLALKTDDIFATMRLLRAQSESGGMEFMPRSPPEYYRKLPERIGKDVLTPEQLQEVEELGLLVDRDDQGVLLQVFTKPISDRPTIFFEIIQRLGCETKKMDKGSDGVFVEIVVQAGGCGGFGKGNFSELFKSIERYEDEALAKV